DMRRRHIPDIREIERQQRPKTRALQLCTQPGQPVSPQAVQVDALLPVNGVRAERADRHRRSTPCTVKVFSNTYRLAGRASIWCAATHDGNGDVAGPAQRRL